MVYNTYAGEWKSLGFQQPPPTWIAVFLEKGLFDKCTVTKRAPRYLLYKLNRKIPEQ